MIEAIILLISIAVGYPLGLYSWACYDIYKSNLRMSKLGPGKEIPSAYGSMCVGEGRRKNV